MNVFDDVYYLIYSSVCRTKKKEKGEANADIVSTVSKYTDYITHAQQFKNVFNLRLMMSLHTQCHLACHIEPFDLKSDQHLVSPYNITPELYSKVMRIKEIISNLRGSWL